MAQSSPTVVPPPSTVISLWPDGKMPGHGATGPETEKPATGDNVQRVTDVSQPTLAIFKAPGKTGPVPAVIVCPGGGYNILAYNLEGTEVAAWLNSLGITALVLKYRVPNNRGGAFEDVQRALHLARARATEWGLDDKKIGIMGFSAGGHLSARLSTGFKTAAYPEIDDADKTNVRPDFAILVYPAYLNKGTEVAPELPITADIPPTLIVHNEDDHAYVPGSKVYHAALDNAKVPNVFLFYPTGGHGYGLRSQKDVKVWPQQAAEWLKAVGILAAQ